MAIHDSYYYRQKLEKLAKGMQKRISQTRWPESSCVKFEFDVFLMFYIIRKLNEATKLPQKVFFKHYKVESYQWLHPTHHRRDGSRVIEYYNMETPKLVNLTLKQLCDFFVHSYYFVLFSELNKNSITSILINSDHTFEKEIYKIELTTLVNICKECQEYAGLSGGNYILTKSGLKNWKWELLD